jgi:hypothetical protein
MKKTRKEIETRLWEILREMDTESNEALNHENRADIENGGYKTSTEQRKKHKAKAKAHWLKYEKLKKEQEKLISELRTPAHQ